MRGLARALAITLLATALGAARADGTGEKNEEDESQTASDDTEGYDPDVELGLVDQELKRLAEQLKADIQAHGDPDAIPVAAPLEDLAAELGRRAAEQKFAADLEKEAPRAPAAAPVPLADHPDPAFAQGGAGGKADDSAEAPPAATGSEELKQLQCPWAGMAPSPPNGPVVPDHAVLEVVVGGENASAVYSWLEGPAWRADEASTEFAPVGTLYFSDVIENVMYNVHAKDKYGPFTPNAVLDPSGSASPPDLLKEPGSNGLLWDEPRRALVVMNHGDRRVELILMHPKHGGEHKRVTVATHYTEAQGKSLRFNSPNDAAFAPNGDLYFTDPAYGLQLCDEPKAREGGRGLPPRAARMGDNCAKGELSADRELDFNGVFRISVADLDRAAEEGGDAAWAKTTAQLVIKDMRRPNGIGFAPRGDALYISDTGKPKEWRRYAFPLADPAQWEVFNTVEQVKATYKDSMVPLLAADMPGGCDGLTVDSENHVWAACPGGVCVFSGEEGSLLGVVVVGHKIGNVLLADDGYLYIAADKQILRVLTAARPAHDWKPGQEEGVYAGHSEL